MGVVERGTSTGLMQSRVEWREKSRSISVYNFGSLASTCRAFHFQTHTAKLVHWGNTTTAKIIGAVTK